MNTRQIDRAHTDVTDEGTALFTGANEEEQPCPKIEFDLDTDAQDDDVERSTWANGFDFVLSLLGYAVGLGNIWRFPYLCMRNGGGAFLIPFLICLVTCGLPLFFMEVAAGQFSGKGTLYVWAVCPLFKGIGIGMTITLAVVTCYYNVILAWAIYYMVNSVKAVLPWSRCDGWWNTNTCVVQGYSPANTTVNYNNHSNINGYDVVYGSNATVISNMNLSSTIVNLMRNSTSMTSEEEFWQYNALQMSGGLGEPGTIPWYLALCFLAAWILVFLCICKGVRSIGKVVYVTALLPYVLLLILLIRGATLPGAWEGVVYYLKPDVDRMMTVQVWIEAALQVFYSLGPGWGPLISMASYNRFNNNILKDSLIVTFVSEGTSIFSGLVVFTILGFISHELGIPIDAVAKSGPGLGFVVYPMALDRLPVSQLWAFLFFFMLIMVGLDSQFCTTEAVITSLSDSFPRLRKHGILLAAAVCAVFFLLGLIFICQSGIYLFQLTDWYVASLGVPMFGLLECIIFAWIYGADRFSQDIEMMIGRGVPVFIRLCWCIISPLILLVCLTFTIVTYRPPSYGDYIYPTYAQAIGWIIALAPIIPVPLVAVYQIWSRHETSIVMKIKASLAPSSDWKPNVKKAELNVEYPPTCNDDTSYWRLVKRNIFGGTKTTTQNICSTGNVLELIR